MPDIRIKDLTTTASTTAADDFFAADGTTNGTRKLSAFSPTFGGNATVGGTLTVNSASTLSNVVVNGTFRLANNIAQYWLDSGATERRLALVSGVNAIYFGPVDGGWGATGYFSAGTAMVFRTNGASGTFNEAVSISTGGVVTIASTSASTTTSSGALVVGNGTSGGLGVGGDVYAGGTTGFKLGSSSGAYRFSAGAFIDAESSSVIRLLDSSANFATVKTGSLIALTPATAPSLTVNSTMTFELTSNTTLKVFVRGTDGTTRSVSLTLA
jgi:hypothetical protein